MADNFAQGHRDSESQEVRSNAGVAGTVLISGCFYEHHKNLVRFKFSEYIEQFAFSMALDCA
jgi:hypothetical protein